MTGEILVISAFSFITITLAVSLFVAINDGPDFIKGVLLKLLPLAFILLVSLALVGIWESVFRLIINK